MSLPDPVKAHAEREAVQAEQRVRSPGRGLADGRRGTSTRSSKPVPEEETLPPWIGAAFTRRLGHDFSHVRVHQDTEAAELAEQADARAVTFGEDIFFGDGEYDPATRRGRELLAHELTHVAQQAELDGHAFSQTQPKPGKDAKEGIGRTPPEEPFEDAEGKAPEDEFVTFNQDSADLDFLDPKKIDALLKQHQGPVDVELHGYASLEGDAAYNRNLSAHRAVAMKRYLADLLPAGSSIRLFAHGETFAFGNDRKKNRRVGIKVTTKVVQQPTGATATTTKGTTEEPGGFIPTTCPGLGPLICDVTLPPPPPRWLEPPEYPPGFKPDYFTMVSPLWAHGQLPTVGDLGLAQARQYYSFYYSILGPEGSIPFLGNASELASSTIGAANQYRMLAENPTAFEEALRFDEEVLGIKQYTLSFDVLKAGRSVSDWWEKRKKRKELERKYRPEEEKK